jgi:hypothetical protein
MNQEKRPPSSASSSSSTSSYRNRSGSHQNNDEREKKYRIKKRQSSDSGSSHSQSSTSGREGKQRKEARGEREGGDGMYSPKSANRSGSTTPKSEGSSLRSSGSRPKSTSSHYSSSHYSSSHYSSSSKNKIVPVFGARPPRVYLKKEIKERIKKEMYYCVIFGNKTGVFDLEGMREVTLNCPYALFSDHASRDEAEKTYKQTRLDHLEKLNSHVDSSKISLIEGESDYDRLDRAVKYFYDNDIEFVNKKKSIHTKSAKSQGIFVDDPNMTEADLLSLVKEKYPSIVIKENLRAHYFTVVDSTVYGIISAIDASKLADSNSSAVKKSSMREALVAVLSYSP